MSQEGTKSPSRSGKGGRSIPAWTIPLVAALAIGVVGWFLERSVERSLKDRVRDELKTILDADVAAVERWIRGLESAAAVLAEDDRLRARVRDLLAPPKPGAPASAADSRRDELDRLLATPLRAQGFAGYDVVDVGARVIAASERARIDAPTDAVHERVSQAPGAPRAVLAGSDLVVAAAIRDETGALVGTLALRLRPEEDLGRIVTVARFGRSGETYAFDRAGVMLTRSRFEDDLRGLGLIGPAMGAGAPSRLALRDPGGDLRAGHRPAVAREQLPLTRMAAAAVAGRDGVDLKGYRDYRGVVVVGAWRWLPSHGFGIATEVDDDEAFETLHAVRRVFLVLFGLFVLCAAGMIAAARLAARLSEKVETAKELGQYILEEKLGEGGMGVVYRASHAMLRRPAAIKLIKAANVSPSALARFEREARMTSQLTHPNTIAVFDYGRTPDDTLYYAMEFLTGISLDKLVKECGPQPDRRAAFILKQVCGSLADAHSIGLVHRDVKPANIMLCVRGGLFDFVKVLDFGLVRMVGGAAAFEPALTAANAITGTPLYVSPEGILDGSKVDARSDIYSVGAVAYFLVTGWHVYDGPTIEAIQNSHVKDRPIPPSMRAGRVIDPKLEALILRCLSKDPRERPDAATLAEQLDGAAWTLAEARAFWEARGVKPAAPAPAAAARQALSVRTTGRRPAAGDMI